MEVLSKMKEVATDLLFLMDVDAEVIIAQREGTYMVNIQCDNPGYLIGKGGEILDCFQHVLRLIVKSDPTERVNILVDVNGYRDKKTYSLQKMAREIAYKVRTSGCEEELEPMNAFERKIVHSIISNIADVETESRGLGADRRIVVKPR